MNNTTETVTRVTLARMISKDGTFFAPAYLAPENSDVINVEFPSKYVQYRENPQNPGGYDLCAKLAPDSFLYDAKDPFKERIVILPANDDGVPFIDYIESVKENRHVFVTARLID